MKPSRPLVLLGLAVLAGVASWAVVRHVYGSLPGLSVSAPAALGVLAILEYYFGYSVRLTLRSPRRDKLKPLGIARMAVLGKATAHGAAIAAGAYAGFLVYTSAALGRDQPTRDAVISGVSVVTALLLLGAGLYLEHGCRVPPSDRDDDRHRDDDRAGHHR